MKEDFSNEEWNNLLTLPYAVSITVIAAAPSFLGAWGESKAMMTEPGKLASASGSALLGLISTEMQSRAKDLVKEQQILMKNDPARYRNEMLRHASSPLRLFQRFPRRKRWPTRNG